MNFKITFLVTFIFGSLLYAQTPNRETSDRIYWDEHKKLNWEDFQGKPQKNQAAAALSSIAIPYGFEANSKGVIKVKLRVCFEKNISWSKKEMHNDRLLAHERLHFDIAELHRRKIVKALKEAKLGKSNYKEKLENIVIEHWKKEYRLMQDRYDRETDFSKAVNKQEEWGRMVKRLLEKHAQYKEENFIIRLGL
ncbi:MAG: hypothetical protein WD530_07205 [Vicingaceae bacterium]